MTSKHVLSTFYYSFETHTDTFSLFCEQNTINELNYFKLHNREFESDCPVVEKRQHVCILTAAGKLIHLDFSVFTFLGLFFVFYYLLILPSHVS